MVSLCLGSRLVKPQFGAGPGFSDSLLGIFPETGLPMFGVVGNLVNRGNGVAPYSIGAGNPAEQTGSNAPGRIVLLDTIVKIVHIDHALSWISVIVIVIVDT